MFESDDRQAGNPSEFAQANWNILDFYPGSQNSSASSNDKQLQDITSPDGQINFGTSNDCYGTAIGTIEPPTKDVLHGFVNQKPDKSSSGKFGTIDHTNLKAKENEIINSLTDTEIKSIADLANALRTQDYSKIDNFVHQYKDNPGRLNDMFFTIQDFLKSEHLGRKDGISIAASSTDKSITLSVKLSDGEPWHYFDSDDGSAP